RDGIGRSAAVSGQPSLLGPRRDDSAKQRCCEMNEMDPDELQHAVRFSQIVAPRRPVVFRKGQTETRVDVQGDGFTKLWKRKDAPHRMGERRVDKVITHPDSRFPLV